MRTKKENNTAKLVKVYDKEGKEVTHHMTPEYRQWLTDWHNGKKVIPWEGKALKDGY